MDWDAVLAARIDHEQLDEFVTVEEAAQRMGVTEQQVRQLVRDRVVESAGYGIGMLVRPAIANRM